MGVEPFLNLCSQFCSPSLPLHDKAFSILCNRAKAMQCHHLLSWDKANRPCFVPELLIYNITSQGKRRSKAAKSAPSTNSGFLSASFGNAGIHWECVPCDLAVGFLKRLTNVMWQNLHMLQWKYIPWGCIFQRCRVIMLPFLHIYCIWYVQLCVQKTNQESKVTWNTTKYAGKVNKRNFIAF